MKIKSIKAEGLFSAHYRFELAFDGQSAIEGKLFETNEKLSTVIDFLFLGKTEGIATDGKAQCEFSSNGTEYTLSREKAYENSICLLTRVQNGNVERFPDADAKLFEIFGADKERYFADVVIDKKDFDEFCLDPSLTRIGCFADLQSVIEKTDKVRLEAEKNKDEIKREINEIVSQGINAVTLNELDQARNENLKLQNEFVKASSELNVLKDSLALLKTKKSITREIEQTKNHISRLEENRGFIEEKRLQLEEHKKLQEVLPKLQEVLPYKKQLDELNEKQNADKQELSVFESERKTVNDRLKEIESELTRKVEQNARILLIKSETESIAGLKERNQKIDEKISELAADKSQLEKLKEGHRISIENIDKSIDETKAKLTEINIPLRSINDLVENVKLGVKIKELDNLLQQNTAESQSVDAKITEQENLLKAAQDTLNAVVRLDDAVAPYKSKDTILQMLQSKIIKGEAILQSLKEKQKNLREEIQNLHYKEIEVDQSAQCLQTLLAQKQYDRDMVIKRQAVSEQQALPGFNNSNLMVAPTTCAYIDEHIESLKSDIVKRGKKKTELVSRQTGLKYVLDEVERQKQIVLGDIVTCRNERDLVIKNYREAIRPEDNALAEKYFQALDLGKSTSFVLDAQRTVVEKQTELNILREKQRGLEKTKKEIADRLNSLSETQKAVDMRQTTVDMLVESNDKLRTDLVDLTEKLILLQNQRKIETDAAEAVQTRLINVSNCISDLENEKKANEKSVEKINQKAALFTGIAGAENANSQEKLNALLSEKKALEESKNEIEDKIFAKCVQIEKREVDLNTMEEEYEQKRITAQSLMAELNGQSIESLKLKNLSDEAYAEISAGVEKYDATVKLMKNRLKTLEKEFEENTDDEKADALREEIESKQEECDNLRDELSQSAENYREMTNRFIESEKSKNKLQVLMERLKDNSAILETSQNAAYANPLLQDKINKLLKNSSDILTKLTGAKAEIQQQNGLFCLDSKPFVQLNHNEKLTLFLALRICDNSVKNPPFETLVVQGAWDEKSVEYLTKIKDKIFT